VPLLFFCPLAKLAMVQSKPATAVSFGQINGLTQPVSTELPLRSNNRSGTSPIDWSVLEFLF